MFVEIVITVIIMCLTQIWGVFMVPLTPLDIHNKEFSKGFRGYDEDEVNEFLDRIIKDYETLIRQNKELEDKNEQLNERISHFTNVEDSINKSILVAQETSEDFRANTKKEYELVIKEAEKNADRIINDALLKQKTIYNEIEDMKKNSTVFRTRFRALLQAELEIIENYNWQNDKDE